MIDHDGVAYEDRAVPTSEVVPSRLTRQLVMMGGVLRRGESKSCGNPDFGSKSRKCGKMAGRRRKTHRIALYAMLMKSPMVLPSALGKL